MKGQRLLWLNITLFAIVLVFLSIRTWLGYKESFVNKPTVKYHAQGNLAPSAEYPAVLYTQSNFTGEAFAIPIGAYKSIEIYPPNVPRPDYKKWIKSLKLMPGASIKMINVVGSTPTSTFTSDQASIGYRLDTSSVDGKTDGVFVAYNAKKAQASGPLQFLYNGSTETCPAGHRLATYQDIQANPNACSQVDEWAITRLANKASMSGPGYGCDVVENDSRTLGSSLCVKL